MISEPLIECRYDRDSTRHARFVHNFSDVLMGNLEEQAYLDLCDEIVRNGELRMDRTETGTYSMFAPPQLRFNLKDDTFPLLTTKRTFFRGVAQELLWFVKGSTDSKELSERDIHIWDGNGSRDFLDKRGLTSNREGDLGPVYGFQWRHFGAEYHGCDADYTDKGVDQLNEVIRLIKSDPYSRRIILSAWNPAAERFMALPPCHILSQFYVSMPKGDQGPKYLNCQMYQRSGDMGLGVPFNIASYALLTRMIAHVTGLLPGTFIHVLGDAHVYANHVEPLRIQCERTPTEFPKLKFKRNDISNIEDFEFEDFELLDYHPQGKIQMKMAV